MKNFVIVLLVITANAFTKAPELKKVSQQSLKIEDPSEYTILFDQIFKLNGLGGDDKILFFAGPTDSLSDTHRPKLFIYRDQKVLDSFVLPGVETGWSLVEVKALAVDTKKSDDKSARILAILNFEPPSGPKDAWDRSYVFDIHIDGKVTIDTKLDKKLDENVSSKHPIKNIKELKTFIEKN